MIIHPVIPWILELKADGIVTAGCVLLTLGVAALVSYPLGRYAANRFRGDRRNTALLFTGVGLCAAMVLLCFFGFAAATVKGFLFALILAFASYEDIKTRECDDCIHLMILIAAFIGASFAELPGMLFSALFTGGIMLLTVAFTGSDIGGADIKLAAACSFLSGLQRGIAGLLIGMLLAVIFNAFKKDKHKGFPMIPYFAVGYMAAYFI